MATLKLARLYSSGFYRVVCVNPVRGTVTGVIIEPLSLVTSSSWSSLMEQSDSGMINKLAQVVTTKSSKVGSFSDQLWTGSNPVQVSVTIGHVAINSTKSEIIDPAKCLLSWNLPPSAMNPLEPPIKTVGAGASEGCSIGIGGWFHARGLLPENVSVNFDSVIDKYSGAPIKFSATITMTPAKILTAPDFLAWFK